MSSRRTTTHTNGAARVRCAIYTRKSSEDGLEQEFNSLDAQRESCEAYIVSQKSAGWMALPDLYDDGGVSGGTMDRPALTRLLADIEAGRVDTVVVYKVDRLTRALNDFAKIVEAFDAKGVSFVSVTQQFNTTTSMGRLTLNMLLSFAQFEREVTGERIRDKIAASKKKGMWMGGNPPLGYDVDDRKLVVNEAEAETVRHIFCRYAKLKSVRALKEELDCDGIVSKTRVNRYGNATGGKPLARGALYLMLQNRIYRGEIVHKDNAYPGLHDAIVDEPLWDEVQAALSENRVERVTRSRATAPSLLAGLVYDESGERMSPTHTNKTRRGDGGAAAPNKKRTRYRYYVSQSLIKRGRPMAKAAACRIPAADLETLIEERICGLLRDEPFIHEVAGGGPVADRKLLIARASTLADRWWTTTPSDRRALLHALIARIDVQPDTVILTIQLAALRAITSPDLDVRQLPSSNVGPTKTVVIPALVKRTGMTSKLLIQSPAGPAHRKADRSLLRLIGQAHRCRRILSAARHSSDSPEERQKTMAEIAKMAGLSPSYFSRVLRLSFLAPDITKMILQGRQPPELNANRIMKIGKVSPSWARQKKHLDIG